MLRFFVDGDYLSNWVLFFAYSTTLTGASKTHRANNAPLHIYPFFLNILSRLQIVFHSFGYKWFVFIVFINICTRFEDKIGEPLKQPNVEHIGTENDTQNTNGKSKRKYKRNQNAFDKQNWFKFCKFYTS